MGGQSFAFNSEAGTYITFPGADYLPASDGTFGLYMFDDPSSFAGIDSFLLAKESWFSIKGDELYISGNPLVSSVSGEANLILGASNGILFVLASEIEEAAAIPAGIKTSATQSGLDEQAAESPNKRWTFSDQTAAILFATLTGNIEFVDFELIGTDQDVAFHADGTDSDVNLIRQEVGSILLPGGSFQATAGRDVTIKGVNVEAETIQATAGRNISLERLPSGQAKLAASKSINLTARQNIRITNSSELRRLSEIDPTSVNLSALDGNVSLSNSVVDADKLLVSSQRGDISILDKMSISAREIKARVFDSGGTLVIGNSTLSNGKGASDLIRLYGEGAGGVRFSGTTTLLGNKVDIAGKTVTIDPGGRVRLSNPTGTSVFADSHNYNNGINGNFTGTGSNAAVTPNKQSFDKRPGF